MTTTIRTIKGTAYTVDSLSLPLQGQPAIIVRQPSGKRRNLTVKDVGRARFEQAVSHYLRDKRAEAVRALFTGSDVS
jgi:hypothetical protein